MNSIEESLINNFMRKHFLFLLLFFCTIKISAQEITGQWRFNTITNKIGDTLITVTDNDFMEIKSDGTFHYELKAKNNLKQGKLFSNGLKKCPSYFSKQMVKMIKDGERNGLLNFVFRDFSDGIADGEFNKDDYCESISN